jgi:AcrR family transcriptional regulator
MDAALRLVDERGFSSLSLREVSREAGIVPTGFYRHFADLDALGFALVDESFRSLREMLRDARRDGGEYTGIIRGSVGIVAQAVNDHPLHFRFIARERSSGVPALRRAIHGEIRLFSSELATDLSRFPVLREWSADDLQMIAALMVNTMVSFAEALLDASEDGPRAEAEVVVAAEHQLRLIALGIPQWHPPDGSGRDGQGARRPGRSGAGAADRAEGTKAGTGDAAPARAASTRRHRPRAATPRARRSR